MKTFRNLRIGDWIYYCSPKSSSFESIKITKLSELGFDTGIGNGGSSSFKIEDKDLNNSRARKAGYHHVEYIFFTEKSDVIRYCKAHLLTTLRGRIIKAKKAIDEVISFRKQHYDELNKDWIELEIQKLERIEKQSL